MGMTYLWDTNIVIYYLQQQLSPAAERFIDSTLLYNTPALSVVSEIEPLCWRNALKNNGMYCKALSTQQLFLA
ncbi:MAG: hypothetical protein AAFQ08_00005 [Bacteroidota bacterium]